MGVFWVFNMKGGVRKLPNNKNTPTRVCSQCSAVEGEVVGATKLEGMRRQGEDGGRDEVAAEHKEHVPEDVFFMFSVRCVCLVDRVGCIG